MNGYGNSQKNVENWLGLNWQFGLSTGWGIAGLNMAWAMERDGRFKAVPLYPSTQLEYVCDELQ
ncbi:MAG: hypothetical protein VYC47_07170, partial [Verrucomicrobiota bacterium]|nr:hypothetical protein [Verrucomicrobiota bacterium]